MSLPELNLSGGAVITPVPYQENHHFSQGDTKGYIPTSGSPLLPSAGGALGVRWPFFQINNLFTATAGGNLGYSTSSDSVGKHSALFFSLFGGLRANLANGRVKIDTDVGYNNLTVYTQTVGNPNFHGALVAAGLSTTLSDTTGSFMSKMDVGTRLELGLGDSSQGRVLLNFSYNLDAPTQRVSNPNAQDDVAAALDRAEATINNIRALFGKKIEDCVADDPDVLNYASINYSGYLNWIDGEAPLNACSLPTLNAQIDKTQAALKYASHFLTSQGSGLDAQSRLRAMEVDVRGIKPELAAMGLDLLVGKGSTQQKSALQRTIALGKEIKEDIETGMVDTATEKIETYKESLKAIHTVFNRSLAYLGASKQLDYISSQRTLECLSQDENCPPGLDTELAVTALNLKLAEYRRQHGIDADPKGGGDSKTSQKPNKKVK